ncbi:MAG: ribosome maturation factor RimP [Firmicutes bacterium]|nr:ribosome maturation factor RimP [Bacillota bacterium]
MANKIETLALDLGDKIADSLGMSVIDAEFKKEDGKQFLRIYIDSADGIGIDDCEKFSRLFSDAIDAEDPIEKEYTLEVSSPGIDRKLKKDREFRHYIGREVDVKLYKKIGGFKEFTGILKDYNAGTAVVDKNGESVEINTKEAIYIRLHFEF